MKAEIYIFGNFADGYSQYPDNYTHNLFEAIAKSRQAESEIIYHREGALTYYIYTREISKIDNTFIGLCYVFNDVLIKDFAPLFSIFEDVITNIVVTGEMLEFANDGKLSTKINQLYTHTEELQRVSDYLNSKLTSIGKITEKLPPVNYGVATNEWKTFSHKDKSDIHSAILDYSNIRIIKGEGYDTATLSSYAGKLNSLNKEKTAALQTIDKQKQEISDLKKKQKNYKLVIWLVVFICIGGIIFISTINSRNAQIQRLNNTIATQERTIDSQNETIGILRDTIISRNSKINDLKTENQRLISSRDSLNGVNRKLNNSIEVLRGEKSDLTRQLSQIESTLKTTNSKIKTLTADKDKLQTENLQLKNRKLEPEKYKVYAKRGTKAYCYYKEGYSYYKTGDSYSDYTIVYVYYKNNKYALTEKGYIKLEDLQKVY
jgi:hypothetical protein